MDALGLGRCCFRKFQDLLEMLLAKLEGELLGCVAVELGRVELVEAHHDPPVLQLLRGPELTGTADLQ